MRWIITGAVSVLLLTGCGATGRFDDSTAEDAAGEPSANSRPACYDGDCALEITGSREIPLDPKFEIETLTITIEDDTLLAEATTTSGGRLQSQMGGDGVGVATLNGIRLRVDGIDGDTATVSISH